MEVAAAVIVPVIVRSQRLNEAHLATLHFDLLTEEEHIVDQTNARFQFDIPNSCRSGHSMVRLLF